MGERQDSSHRVRRGGMTPFAERRRTLKTRHGFVFPANQDHRHRRFRECACVAGRLLRYNILV